MDRIPRRWQGAGARRSATACSLLHDTIDPGQRRNKEFDVSITVGHITPIISLVAGVLILVIPALLNYIVAIYLIVAGVVGPQ
jgi:hypothetical protein